MNPVATLIKETKKGHAVWNFYLPSGKSSVWSAVSDDGKDFKFHSVELLRDYYRQMIAWGFTPVPLTP